MDQLQQIFVSSPAQVGTFSLENVLISMLLAYVLGQVLAWVYYATHSGLSYSKNFVQSLVLITIVVALVMAVIGNSLVTAFGLMGALAIIRFRNILKDTRDLSFIFCSLVIGMATGSQRFGVAIFGTLFLCLVVFLLHWTAFGTHRPFNGFLRFQLAEGVGPNHPLMDILKRFCKSFTLVSVQDRGFGSTAEYAYQLMVKDYTRNEEMLFEIELIEGIESINLVMQEDLLEV